MQIEDFTRLYESELQEARSLEAQLVEALPKLTEAASHPALKRAFESHLEETRSHLAVLDTILRRHDLSPREHVDQAMQALVEETEKMLAMVEDRDVRDASMIASAQRVEHYEIAVYGTLSTYAKELGAREDQADLHRILEEEKAADGKLTRIAKEIVNPDALAA